MYTDERNAQIVLSLLKTHKVKRIVVSPGTTNACLVGSMQNDDFFELYSAPEERSAAYMACGIAAQTGEPVVLSCTGATASRNYMPALTEAFYRHLPILVITSSRRNAYIGHCIEQVTDRTLVPNDVVNISVQMPVVHDSVSEWECNIAANKAILALFGSKKGPAHINLETTYSVEGVKSFEPANAIYKYEYRDKWPKLQGKVAVVVGSHLVWDKDMTDAVDEFCEKYDGIVLCDQTGNYWGKYRLFGCLAAFQNAWTASYRNADIVIHIGDVSAAVYKLNMKEVWRVNPDGELRDTFQKLKNIFSITELDFFRKYNSMKNTKSNTSFWDVCRAEEKKLRSNIPEIPFSNAWMASVTAGKLPKNSILHLGINNSLRVWNFFDHTTPIMGFSNVGGFGIDGVLSTAMGAALCTDKIVYCVLGDLAFFYDLNALGNRHFPKNVRILVVNNGLGMEMSFEHALAHKIAGGLDTESESYISACGHYASKSPSVIKEYVSSLGFDYYRVSSKEEYKNILSMFTSEKVNDKPLVIEAIVEPQSETIANASLGRIIETQSGVMKNTIKGFLGEKNISSIKKIIK